MRLYPAIDLQNGQCVRLRQGDFATAERVAADAVDSARGFAAAGAQWLHVVDLDGARTGAPVNRALIARIVKESGLRVQVGGGIRSRATLGQYFEMGVERCILGSAALKDPAFVEESINAYGARIAIGLDAKNGFVATEGWLDVSDVPLADMARRMEAMGVRTLIVTDIGRDGMLSGANAQQLAALASGVSCAVIASGGVRDLADLAALKAAGAAGVICGKSLYSGTLDLKEAIAAATDKADALNLDRFFEKAPLIPAVVQDEAGRVLMLAYMSRLSLQKTVESGQTWFFSRSRRALWHKGATSGHTQEVLSVRGDCDADALLLTVRQTGAACHTGAYSCFFDIVIGEEEGTP